MTNPQLNNLHYFLSGDIRKSICATVYGYNQERAEKCRLCGLPFFRAKYSELEAEIRYPQKKWPDLLYATACPSLINTRVLNDLQEAGVHDYKIHPVKLINVPVKYTPTPDYWILEPIVETSYKTIISPTDIRNKIICKECGYWDWTKLDNADKLPMPIYKLVKEPPSHNFIYARRSVSFLNIWTQKIVDLAHEKKWSYCKIRNVEYMVEIDHLNPDWQQQLLIDIQRREEEVKTGTIIDKK